MWKLLTIIRRNVTPLNAIHPGEHLAEELKELGMSAAELARQLDVPEWKACHHWRHSWKIY
jgi:hypothetical protein